MFKSRTLDKARYHGQVYDISSGSSIVILTAEGVMKKKIKLWTEVWSNDDRTHFAEGCFECNGLYRALQTGSAASFFPVRYSVLLSALYSFPSYQHTRTNFCTRTLLAQLISFILVYGDIQFIWRRLSEILSP